MLKKSNKIPCQCPHCLNFLHEKYCFAVRNGTVMNNYTDHLSEVKFPKRTSLKDGRIPNRSTVSIQMDMHQH
ncbi:unnamed protein product [Schistosoma spindalis]|nr:unnamed protein product [Schistosoma spindale]